MSAEAIRVLVVDDHTLFRKGVKALLATIEHVEVAGEACSGPEAVALARDLRPDIVLMDLEMPGGGGLAATREIAAELPECAVLVLTMNQSDESLLAALRAGARGYVVKDADPDDLVRAVESVAHGDAVLGREVADRLTALLGPGGAAPFPELTESERSVLALMARGATNAEIAHDLFLAGKTVRNYVSSIFAKLGVTDRAQAIVRARDAGLHDSGPPSRP